MAAVLLAGGLAAGGMAAAPTAWPAPASSRTLTLEAAVAEALARAPEIRSAEAALERAGAGVGVARAGRLPTVEGTGDVRRTETWKSISALGLDEATFGAGLSVRQRLLTFGRLSKAIEAATAEEAAALAALAEARLAVRFAVETAFLDLLLARERLDAAREAVSTAEALRERARVREEAGAGTRFDVVRAEAERAAALSRRAEAEAAVENTRGRLAAAIGLPPSAPVEADGDLAAAPAAAPVDSAVEVALAERPDLAALAHRVRAARARAGAERAGTRPSIDAVASASYTRHEYVTASPFFSGQDASSGYVGLGVSWPLFDGHRSREAARAEEAAAAGIEADLERARIAAERDVREAGRDLDAARAAVAAREAGIVAAREALRMAELSFDAGRGTALDVIQASLALTEARIGLAEALHRRRLALARLVRAAGTDAVLDAEAAE